MTLWLGAAVAAVAVGIALRVLSRAELRRVDRLRVAAEHHEALGQFAEACYHYAEAAAGRPRHVLATRVRQLWQEHGPFTFDAVHERVIREYCECCTSCGEGYHQGVLRNIERIIGAEVSD